MSWQSDIDAWLLQRGVVTQKPCPGCDQAIKPGEDTETIKDGTIYHRFCFNVSVASLEADLETIINEENGWTKQIAEDGRVLWMPPPEMT